MLLSVSRPSHVFCLSKPSVLFAQGLSTFPQNLLVWVWFVAFSTSSNSTHFHQSTSSNSHHSLVFSCFPFSLRIPALSKGYTGPVHIVSFPFYPPFEFRDKKGEPNWIILSLFPSSFQSNLWAKVFPIAGCVLWRKKSVRGDLASEWPPLQHPSDHAFIWGRLNESCRITFVGFYFEPVCTFEMGGLLHMV